MYFSRFSVWLLIFLFCRLPLLAQWDAPAYWDYRMAPLGSVLEDIGRKYGVNFSYSPDFIEVDRKVTHNASGRLFEPALAELLDLAQVSFIRMESQVVLKQKKAQASPKIKHLRLSARPLPTEVPQLSPLYPVEDAAERLANLMRRPAPYNDLVPLPDNPIKTSAGSSQPRNYSVQPVSLPENKPAGRLAQISLLPYIGTNAFNSQQLVNRLSVNVVWGTNGGVSGFEVGGLINHIRKNVVGFQVAGLGNMVNGRVQGMQFAGAFNVNRGQLDGFQLASLFNGSGGGKAVQLAGGFNLAYGNISGLQAAGLFNRAGGSVDGLQVAGLMNVAEGKVRTQIALLANVSGQIEKSQLSLLFNKTATLEGLQFSLVNVSDTVRRGVPVGILTLVKNGYNRLEVSAGDLLSAGIAVKPGAYVFYNIFFVGFRWQAGEHALGLGYGIGSALRLGGRALLNLELLSTQIDESGTGFNTLHLLNQFRCLFEARVGKRTSFFAGPTFNVMLSKKYNPETGIWGTALVPHTLYDFTDSRGLNRKIWIGFNAGIRL